MIIRDLGSNLLTVSLDGPECEQMARLLFDASQGCCESEDGDMAETLAGYFTMAAMVCNTAGVFAIEEEGMAKLHAIRLRIQGEEGKPKRE